MSETASINSKVQPDKNQWLVMLLMISRLIISNTVSETALINSKVQPDKNQRLLIISDIYHVKYSVRNSLDRLKGTAPINSKLQPR